MSRRATREVHGRIFVRYRPPEGAGPGCAVPALVLLLAIVSCVHGPSVQDQADLQVLASAVSHASACIPRDEAVASMDALARLGVRLTSRAQAEAIWNASRPILNAATSWLTTWLTTWLLQRPPP